MERARHDRVRLYEVVRSAHLERARLGPPATTVFRTRRYDFDPVLAEGLDLVEARTAWSMALLLARSRIAVLEINEPLMRSSLARTAVAVLVVRAAARLRRRPVSVVTYAIENRDPFSGPSIGPLRSRLRRWLDHRLARAVAASVDRIAFGTAAAEELYRGRLPAISRATSALVPALPAACTCGPLVADPDHVLFVGALSPRKGVDLLLDAWPEVVRLRPTARLTVVGSGPLQELVADLAVRRPDVTLIVDPPRVEVHRALREAALLVLLSQPTSTWREQVGLPLVEALAHGCTVVTTRETGLARWLSDHGHAVLCPTADRLQVAAAIAGALGASRPAASVLADLPEVDGRLAADDWLTSGARSR